MKTIFLTIKEKMIELEPNNIAEAHAINNNQTQIMFNNGYKVILNVGFEEIQFFLVDQAEGDITWAYVPGICGKTVMFRPDMIEDASQINPEQSELVYVNKKYLYINLRINELKRIIEYAKKGAVEDVTCVS
jgi:hypothetical protein